MNNVSDLLKDRGIKYRESGKDYLIRCLNPDHEDNNPSLRIDKITGIFNCFSCGFKGNIFSYFGAEPNKIDQDIAALRDKITRLLSNRTLELPADAIPFNRNYRGISYKIYNEFGAFISNAEDEFRDRILFPLYDIRGNIKAFMGRAMHTEVESKYLFYPKNVNLPIFPAHPQIYKNTLIVVEGLFDALNLIDKGCRNVICAFGTGTLFKGYKDKLAHYKILGVNKYYIMFDGDKAGNTAGEKLEKLWQDNDINAEQIVMPEGRDPGELTEPEVQNFMELLYGENSSS